MLACHGPAALLALCIAAVAAAQPERVSGGRDAGAVAAVSGAVGPRAEAFGAGCLGSGAANTCRSLNGQGGVLSGVQLSNEYAYGVQMTAPTKIVGFRLFTAARPLATSTPAYSSCALYLASPTNPDEPDLLPVSSGTLAAYSTESFYPVYLDRPVLVAAGAKVWLAQRDTFNVQPSDLAFGTPPAVPTMWRRLPVGANAWQPTVALKHPAWQLICDGGAATAPVLSHVELPRVGANMSLVISLARPTAASWIAFGASDQTWAGLNLPWPLGPFGAIGCDLLVSPDVIVPAGTTSACGTQSLGIVLPNRASLVGARVYTQAWIADPVNALGLVMSNGVRIEVGQ